MLGKLLKYELRATAPFMALLTVAMLGSAGLARLLTFLAESLDSAIVILPAVLSVVVKLFYAILAVASLILVYAMLVYRFGTNLFGGAGYLTLTLPVKRTTHLAAKLIIGVLCMLAALIVLVGSLCILLSSQLGMILNEVVPVLDSGIGFMAKMFGVSYPIMIVYLCLSCFIGIVQGILTLYCSVAIGQMFTGHIVIGSFIGYVAINAVTKTASNLLSLFMGLGGELERLLTGVFGYSAAVVPSQNFTIYLITSLVLSLALTAALWFVTRLILNRAVNLQ